MILTKDKVCRKVVANHNPHSVVMTQHELLTSLLLFSKYFYVLRKMYF